RPRMGGSRQPAGRRQPPGLRGTHRVSRGRIRTPASQATCRGVDARAASFVILAGERVRVCPARGGLPPIRAVFSGVGPAGTYSTPVAGQRRPDGVRVAVDKL